MTKMSKKKKVQTEVKIDYTIQDLDISSIIPNVINDCVVTIIDGYHTIIPNMNCSGLIFRSWLSSRGGVFSKDVLNYTRKKSHGKYVILKNESINCIARLIEDDELSHFKTLKFIDGTVKDKKFMILKHINSNQKLTCSSLYEEDLWFEEPMLMPIKQVVPPIEEDFDKPANSISLFTD